MNKNESYISLYREKTSERESWGFIENFFFFPSLSPFAYTKNINLFAFSNIIYGEVSWSDSFQLDAPRTYSNGFELSSLVIETCQIETNCLLFFDYMRASDMTEGVFGILSTCSFGRVHYNLINWWWFAEIETSTFFDLLTPETWAVYEVWKRFLWL